MLFIFHPTIKQKTYQQNFSIKLQKTSNISVIKTNLCQQLVNIVLKIE
jgi:hypothetical protein